jgi:hypothetical protein
MYVNNLIHMNLYTTLKEVHLFHVFFLLTIIPWYLFQVWLGLLNNYIILVIRKDNLWNLCIKYTQSSFLASYLESKLRTSNKMRCLITFFIASFCKILNFTKLLVVWRSCRLWSTLYAIVDWLEARKFSHVFVFCSSLMLLCMQDLVIPPLVLFSMLLITTQGYILFFTSTLTMDLVVLHLRKLCFQLFFFLVWPPILFS